MKEFFEAIGQRIRSPFWGYVALAFLAVNWKSIYIIVFADEDPYHKFKFFDANTSIYTLYVVPLSLGLGATLLAPYIANWASWWASKPVNSRRIRDVDAAHKVLQVKNKFTVEREREKALIEQSLIDKAIRDEQVSRIENDEIKETLDDALTEFRDISEESTKSNQAGEGFNSDRLAHLMGELKGDIKELAMNQFDTKGTRHYVGLVGNDSDMQTKIFDGINPDLIFANKDGGAGKTMALKVARRGTTLVVGPSVDLTTDEIVDLKRRGVTLFNIA